MKDFLLCLLIVLGGAGLASFVLYLIMTGILTSMVYVVLSILQT